MRGARLGALLPFVVATRAVHGPLSQQSASSSQAAGEADPPSEFGLVPSSCPGPLVLTAPSGIITDGPGRYSANLNCAWLISAYGPVEITFTSLDLEWGFDILRVYAGATSKAPLLGGFTELMGSSPPVTLSSPGAMYLWFSSDISVERSGFVARYSVVGTDSVGVPGAPPAGTAARSLPPMNRVPQNYVSAMSCSSTVNGSLVFRDPAGTISDGTHAYTCTLHVCIAYVCGRAWKISSKCGLFLANLSRWAGSDHILNDKHGVWL